MVRGCAASRRCCSSRSRPPAEDDVDARPPGHIPPVLLCGVQSSERGEASRAIPSLSSEFTSNRDRVCCISGCEATSCHAAPAHTWLCCFVVRRYWSSPNEQKGGNPFKVSRRVRAVFHTQSMHVSYMMSDSYWRCLCRTLSPLLACLRSCSPSSLCLWPSQLVPLTPACTVEFSAHHMMVRAGLPHICFLTALAMICAKLCRDLPGPPTCAWLLLAHR